MTQPHVCPVCKGEGKVPQYPGTMLAKDCPACKGACVLWEPKPLWLFPEAPTIHRYPPTPGPDFNVKASQEAVAQMVKEKVVAQDKERVRSMAMDEIRLASESLGRVKMFKEILAAFRNMGSKKVSGTRAARILEDNYGPRFIEREGQ